MKKVSKWCFFCQVYFMSSVFCLFFNMQMSLRDCGTWGDIAACQHYLDLNSRHSWSSFFLCSFTCHVFGNREPQPECLYPSSWWCLISKVELFSFIVLVYWWQNTNCEATMFSVMFVCEASKKKVKVVFHSSRVIWAENSPYELILST